MYGSSELGEGKTFQEGLRVPWQMYRPSDKAGSSFQPPRSSTKGRLQRAQYREDISWSCHKLRQVLRFSGSAAVLFLCFHFTGHHAGENFAALSDP